MRLSKKKKAFAVIVDNERFDNVDIKNLHPYYSYYFNLWQYSNSLQQRQCFEDNAYIYEIFLIFDEAKYEVETETNNNELQRSV